MRYPPDPPHPEERDRHRHDPRVFDSSRHRRQAPRGRNRSVRLRAARCLADSPRLAARRPAVLRQPGPSRGRRWAATAARSELRQLAAEAGVRRRFAPHQRAAPTRSSSRGRAWRSTSSNASSATPTWGPPRPPCRASIPQRSSTPSDPDANQPSQPPRASRSDRPAGRRPSGRPLARFLADQSNGPSGSGASWPVWATEMAVSLGCERIRRGGPRVKLRWSNQPKEERVRVYGRADRGADQGPHGRDVQTQPSG